MLWTLAVCVIFSGRFLAAKRNYTFSFIVAALICLNFPLGTLLGVFTIIVLVRPSVKAGYEGKAMVPNYPESGRFLPESFADRPPDDADRRYRSG